MKVEGEEGELAGDGVVLLLVTHVGAAESRLPKTQVGVPLRKRHALKETDTYFCLNIDLLLSVVPVLCGEIYFV